MSSVEWFKRRLRDKHGVKEAELEKERDAKEKRERAAKAVLSPGSSTRNSDLRVGGHSSHIVTLAFSPDGKYLASGSSKDVALLWEVPRLGEKGYKPRFLKTHSQTVESVAFSPDGKYLASGCKSCNSHDSRDPRDTVLGLWELSRLDERGYEPLLVKSLHGPSAFFDSLSFSPDGKQLASFSWGGSAVYLWDVSRLGEKSYTPLYVRDRELFSVAFSPNGRYVAACSRSQLLGLHLWDVSRLGDKNYKGEVSDDSTMQGPIVFSPDSKRVVGCVNLDGTPPQYGIVVRELKP